VVKLLNQLALSLREGAGDIRVLSNRYQLRKAGQLSAQRDALFVAAPVLQGDVDIHITRIPSPQMRPERRQGVQYERTLLRYETRAHADHAVTKDDSLSVVRLVHRGLASGALIGAH
jgi:hypothetical protein